MTNKNKHLTYYDRLDIEEGISKGKTFRSIGIELDKDPTTISKEIKRNLQYKATEVVTKTLDGKLIKANCALLNKPPYVCNNCSLKEEIVVLINVSTMQKRLNLIIKKILSNQDELLF